MKLDENKLATLNTTNELINKEFGEHGTEQRIDFDRRAMTWFYGEILRERRKSLKMTQHELALKIGKKQSYIARVEKGDVDIQVSSFFLIAKALGIEFTPKYI